MKVQAFFKNSSGWVENSIGNSISFVEYENGTLGWDEQPTRLMKWIANKTIKFYRSSGISEFEFNTDLLRRKYDYYKIIQQNFAGYWEDVSEYDCDASEWVYEVELFKHDLAEYKLTGYPTRTICRRVKR